MCKCDPRWARWLLLAALGGSVECQAPTTPVAASPQRPTQLASAEPWRAAVPPPGERGTLVYPTPQVRELDNGMSLVVVQQPTRVVSLAVVSHQGASGVEAGKSGTAALAARMLTEGSLRRSAEQMALAADELGTQLFSSAGRDYATVGLTVLREDLEPALELLAEVVTEPAFSDTEVKRVRGEWIDGLVAERQDPQRLATLAALRLVAGPVHGAPVRGGIPDVEGLTSADLRDFYRQSFTPANLAVLAVGDVNADDLSRRIDAHFAAWRPPPPNASTVTPLPEPPVRRRIVLVDRPDAVQSALAVIQPFPSRSTPGYEAREVLNAVLGGLFTSRLNENLRERLAITYGAASTAIATRHWGALLIATTVEAKATQQAIEEIVAEVAALSTGTKPVSEAELERARAALIHEHAAGLESTGAIVNDTSVVFINDLGWDYLSRFPSLVDGVTAEAVTAEARERLHPDQLTVVVVGPRGQIESGLRTGEQTVETAHPALLE